MYVPTGATREFNAAEIGALAHLYRGEIYRSTAWRTRLETFSHQAQILILQTRTVIFVPRTAGSESN